MKILRLLLCSGALLLAESAAGLHWTPPAGWKVEAGARPMRVTTYDIQAAPGDKDAAECAVYFFGQGGGGSVGANLNRWKGQFRGPAAKTEKRIIHGVAVSTMDVSGEYSGMGGPLAQEPVKAAYRMLGAIAEGPGGNVFFKFTGPAKTIAANRAKFEGLLDSIAK